MPSTLDRCPQQCQVCVCPAGDALCEHPAVAPGDHLRAWPTCFNSTSLFPSAVENGLGTIKVIFHAV